MTHNNRIKLHAQRVYPEGDIVPEFSGARFGQTGTPAPTTETTTNFVLKSGFSLMPFIVETLVVGLASLGAAELLQYGYKVTDFYPPKWVFYFAIGATVHIVFEILGLNRKYVEYKSVSVSKPISPTT